MSIDYLQNKIRKTKNPSILEIRFDIKLCPQCFLPEEETALRYKEYIRCVLSKLKGVLPGVRFSFGSFAMCGPEGMTILAELMKFASEQDFYVILDAPEIYSPVAAQLAADSIFAENSAYCADGVVVSAYPGSDIWKPFIPHCEKNDKDLFVAVRTGSKSAPELQDLLSGSRLVHTVAADHVNRYGGQCVGRSGYSRVSVMASASGQESLRSLRGKYPKLFLLVEGYDYPSANAKNCAAAFDKLGHGAAVCACDSILGAWQSVQEDPDKFEEYALAAAERMKKNLTRYITVL